MRLTSFILAGALSVLSVEAQAATVQYKLTGAGINATFALTYGSVTDEKYNGTATPSNGGSTSTAYKVTAATGSLSYSDGGPIFLASISGLADVKQDAPEDTNLLAPKDFSRFAVASGLEPHNSISYDNLLWPTGSPQTASDYPLGGGPLDIYGVLLSLGDGVFLNVWSDGAPPGGKPAYGFAIVNKDAPMAYSFDGATLAPVPLPAAGFALVAGVGALAAASRKKKAA